MSNESSAANSVANSAAQAVAQLTGEQEHVVLTVAGMELEVVGLRAHEGVSRLFRFDIVCKALAAGPTPSVLIGQPVHMELRTAIGASRHVQGICHEASRFVREDGGAEVKLAVGPLAYPLSIGRDCRVFSDMTVPAIVADVLERNGVKGRFDLTRTYRTRVYTAQYREDDWVFVSRLCEEEGIYYWFDHRSGSEVVFSDLSTGAPEIEGGGMILFAIEHGMTQDEETIKELASEAHATPTKFTVGSFDEQRPALKVTATRGDGVHEMYDAPGGGPIEPSDCERRANDRLEAAQAARGGVSGTATSVRLAPGMVMTIAGHPDLDDTYFITETIYEVKQRRRGPEETTADHSEAFYLHFEAIKRDVPFRPQETSPISIQTGLQSGRVVGPPGEEIHSDGRGRVRLQFHWDRIGGWDDKAGKWMRVAQRGTASSMMYPRTGWNVMAFMEEGNVDAPSILSRVHDAEHPPTYALPANKTRTVFRTQTSPADGTSNEIRFEDLDGAEEMFLNATKDMNFVTKAARSDGVGNDQTRNIAGNQQLDVAERFGHNVGKDQTFSVGGNEEFTITSTRSMEVGGNETVKIGGNRKVEVGSNSQVSVNKTRKLEVGGNLEEKTNGHCLYGAGKTDWKIGGSMTLDTERMLTCDVGEGHDQKIAGSKLEIVGADRPYIINETCTETFKSSLLMSTKKRFMDGTKYLTFWKVDGAITGKAPIVLIEARKKIELKCGSTSITIDEKSVTISTPTYDLSSSAQLISDTSTIQHN